MVDQVGARALQVRRAEVGVVHVEAGAQHRGDLRSMGQGGREVLRSHDPAFVLPEAQANRLPGQDVEEPAVADAEGAAHDPERDRDQLVEGRQNRHGVDHLLQRRVGPLFLRELASQRGLGLLEARDLHRPLACRPGDAAGLHGQGELRGEGLGQRDLGRGVGSVVRAVDDQGAHRSTIDQDRSVDLEVPRTLAAEGIEVRSQRAGAMVDEGGPGARRGRRAVEVRGGYREAPGEHADETPLDRVERQQLLRPAHDTFHVPVAKVDGLAFGLEQPARARAERAPHDAEDRRDEALEVLGRTKRGDRLRQRLDGARVLGRALQSLGLALGRHRARARLGRQAPELHRQGHLVAERVDHLDQRGADRLARGKVHGQVGDAATAQSQRDVELPLDVELAVHLDRRGVDELADDLVGEDVLHQVLLAIEDALSADHRARHLEGLRVDMRERHSRGLLAPEDHPLAIAAAQRHPPLLVVDPEMRELHARLARGDPQHLVDERLDLLGGRQAIEALGQRLVDLEEAHQALFGGDASGLVRRALPLAVREPVDLQGEAELLGQRHGKGDLLGVEGLVLGAVEDERSDRTACGDHGDVQLAIPPEAEGKALQLDVALEPSMLDERRLGAREGIGPEVGARHGEPARHAGDGAEVHGIDVGKLVRAEDAPLVPPVAEPDGVGRMLEEAAAARAEGLGDDAKDGGDEVRRPRDLGERVDRPLQRQAAALAGIAMARRRTVRRRRAHGHDAIRTTASAGSRGEAVAYPKRGRRGRLAWLGSRQRGARTRARPPRAAPRVSPESPRTCRCSRPRSPAESPGSYS